MRLRTKKIKTHIVPKKTTEEELRLEGHRGAVNAVCWSSGGGFVLSGSEDRTVRVWDIKYGKELSCFEAHAAAITAVACSPDDTNVVAGDESGTIFVWDLKTGRQAYHVQLHQKPIQSLVFSVDGEEIVSSALGGTVSIWDRMSRREVQHLTLDYRHWHTKRAVLSSDGVHAISLEEYGTVGLWDIADEHRIAEIADCTGNWPVGFSPDSSIAFYQTYGSLSFWDTHAFVEISQLNLARWSDSLVEIFDPDPQNSSDLSASSLLNDWHELPPLPSDDLPHRLEKYPLVAPDFLNASRVWDLGTATYLTDFFEPTAPELPYDIDYPEEIFFDSTDFEGLFADIDDYPELAVASAVAVAPDNHRAVISVGSGLHLLNLEEQDVEQWQRVHEGRIRTIAWSPNGHHVAAGGNDMTVRIWKIPAQDAGSG